MGGRHSSNCLSQGRLLIPQTSDGLTGNASGRWAVEFRAWAATWFMGRDRPLLRRLRRRSLNRFPSSDFIIHGRNFDEVAWTRLFVSLQYAVKSQLAYHGFSVDDGLIQLLPRSGTEIIEEDDVLEVRTRAVCPRAFLGHPHRRFNSDLSSCRAATVLRTAVQPCNYPDNPSGRFAHRSARLARGSVLHWTTIRHRTAHGSCTRTGSQ